MTDPAAPFRALALDLDGTLLRPDDSISDRDRAAVMAAAEAGWHVILATARWYQLAERTAHALGLVDPVIACSGAEVRRLRDGADLLDIRLPAAFTADVVELCGRTRGVVMAYEDRDVAITSPISEGWARMPEVRHVTSLTDIEAAPRCILLFGTDMNAAALAELRPRWEHDVRFLSSMSGTGHSVLTLTGHGADKGRALGVACADLGIDPSEVVAFGDSETDVEMFRVAGAGVAMGQAPASVRAAATWVTASNGDDGVGQMIERLLAGESGPAQ